MGTYIERVHLGLSGILMGVVRGTLVPLRRFMAGALVELEDVMMLVYVEVEIEIGVGVVRC